MFNFTGKPPVTSTTGPTTFNPTSTFSSSTVSQPWTPFGTLSTSQPVTMGGGVQNTSTISPFGNLTASTTPANITLTNGFGTSPFGINQTAPITQPPNIFNSNLTGTTIKFGAVSAQGTFPTAATTSNIFGTHNTTTTTAANPFGTPPSTMFNTSGNIFNQPIPTASVTTTPWTLGASAAPPRNIFGTSTSSTPNPFNTHMFTPPVTTSAFSSSTTTTNPFVVQPVTTQSPFSFKTNTSTSAPFMFVSQPAANTNIFSQPKTATSSSSIVPITTTNIFGVPISTTTLPTTSTPAFPALNPTVPTSSATNIFSIPAVTIGNAAPITSIFGTKPAVPTTASFPFASTATSILGNNTPPTTTTMASTFQPQFFQGFPVTQTQPAVTSSSSAIISQPPSQEQISQQTVPTIQQQFLGASLLDPYANRGKKDFTNIDQIQLPTEIAAASTSSTTTAKTTLITSTPIPATIPIQSNFQKVPASRSPVDVNFKLKPVSSSAKLNDDMKPSHQQSAASMGSTKTTLTGNFTDEEEIVLLSRTKMSKLRLSNDLIDSSYQSNTIRSLYPLRSLADLEKLTDLPPPSSMTTTVNTDRTSHPSTKSNISSDHRSIPSIIPKQSSSPIIQRKSNDDASTNRLPILTRNDYYMKPSLTELKSLFNDKGQCILKQFTVGHEKYGSVTFYGQINVAGLNLDEIIEINHQEVIVYPDDNNKPSEGEELNLPACITLLGIYPIDRTTREEITDMERIKAMNYNDHLREITKKFDGEFLKYGINDGSWTFMVKHFTRYGLDRTSNFIEFDKTIVDESKLNA